jgi:hypothetical protein
MLAPSGTLAAEPLVPALHPWDAPRERAKTPYTAAEISGFLVLADAHAAPGPSQNPTICARPTGHPT